MTDITSFKNISLISTENSTLNSEEDFEVRITGLTPEHSSDSTSNTPLKPLQFIPIEESHEESENNDEFECSTTNLIINYLPQHMSECDIHSLFSSIGKLESCKLIKDKTTHQSLGYAFVKYESAECAAKAVSLLNRMRLAKKTIKVSYARPTSVDIKNANLYVSGLSTTCTEKSLRNLFQPYGKIVTCKVLVDSSTNEGRGVGFVRFDRKQEAEKAVDELNAKIPADHNLVSRPLTVKFANIPGQRSNTTSSFYQQEKNILLEQQSKHFYYNFNEEIDGSKDFASNENEKSSQDVDPNQFQCIDGKTFINWYLNVNRNRVIYYNNQRIEATTLGCYCIFISNLPEHASDLMIFQLFARFGAVDSVHAATFVETGLCKGYGFVTMPIFEEACDAVLGLNGASVDKTPNILQVFLTRWRF